jgi:hypothetical protein
VADTFQPAFIVGLFVGLGIAAIYYHRKGRPWARNILGLLSLGGLGLFAFALYTGFSQSAARLDQGLRAGCEAGCAREGGAAQLCQGYCQCILDELHERHSITEIDDMVVAASRHGSAEAAATLNAPAASCLERSQKESR